MSEGDKIRNFILMGLPAKQQNDFYEKYWNKIELCTDYDVSMFVRDYLSVKRQLIPSMIRCILRSMFCWRTVELRPNHYYRTFCVMPSGIKFC